MIWLLFLLLLWCGSARGESIVVTDNFNRANETPLASPWVSVLNTLNLVSNGATTPSNNDGTMRHNTTIGNDGYSQFVIATMPPTLYLGPTYRTSSVADTHYFAYVNSGGSNTLYKKVAGSFTSLASGSAAWANGDTVRLVVQGAVLHHVRNGSILLTATDTAIASGQAGMLISDPSAVVDNFEAGQFDWQSIGTLGSTQSSTANQASLALTTTAACESGNVCACIVAVDNNGTGDGDEGAVTSITDSASNTWTEVVEFANGQGTAQTGAVSYLGYTKATGTIASSGTITANFSNSASRDASAMTCWEFSVPANYTISTAGTATLATDGADPGAITISSLSSVEYLWLHGLAAEGPNTDAYTWDADYTQLSANGTGATAPAHDVTTESATWTTTPDPFTFSHAAASSGVKAAMVFIFYEGVSTDLITSVTYGGTTMTRVNIACDTTGEPGCGIAYHLGASIAQGTQTVSIDHTATSTVKIATAVTMTGSVDTETCGAGTLTSDVQNPQIAVNCTNSALRYFVLYSGNNDPTNSTLIAGMTALTDHDFGTKMGRVDRQTNPTSGSTTVGYTDGAANDVGMVAFGVSSIDVAASNMHIRGGFRIFTGTTDTVDVTSTTADRDYAQGYAALLATVGVSTCNKGSLALLGVGC